MSFKFCRNENANQWNQIDAINQESKQNTTLFTNIRINYLWLIVANHYS